MPNLVPNDPNRQRVEAELGESYMNRLINDDPLAFQILSRLPAKSLMRFKCVCKGWKLTIEQNSNFIDLHHARSQSRPCLSISAINGRKLLILTADLQQECDINGGVVSINSSIQSVKRIQLPFYRVDILGSVVGGMLCLFDKERASVQMCNITTGEVTPWIESTVLAWNKFKPGLESDRPKCYFGFDPRTGKHKAVNVWGERGIISPKIVCEVLTAGERSWRVIDDVPPCYPSGSFVSGYANGSIYWFVLECRGRFELSESLITFDVGSEKFRMIRIRNPGWFPRMGRLIEMDGCATLIRYPSIGYEVKMFKLEGGEEEDCWSEVGIKLPFDCSGGVMDFHPIPPGRDQMIMLQSQDERVANSFLQSQSLNVNYTGFYCYDARSNTLNKFQINWIPSPLMPFYCATKCSAFVENLRPLLPRN